MSAHDKGTFGALLEKAKGQGARNLHFRVDLNAGDEDERRWMCWTEEPDWRSADGRTGEEALRLLVGE